MAEPSPPSVPAKPPQRAFAQGVGTLLQTVGVLMFLSSCCICSMSGNYQEPLDRSEVSAQLQQNRMPNATTSELLADPGKAGAMLTMMFSTAGGLALLAFGLGMQSDKRRAGLGAVISCVLLLSVLLGAGVGIWRGDSAWLLRLWHAILALVTLFALGFAWAGWREVSANPPPVGFEILPPDFDEAEAVRRARGKSPARATHPKQD